MSYTYTLTYTYLHLETVPLVYNNVPLLHNIHHLYHTLYAYSILYTIYTYSGSRDDHYDRAAGALLLLPGPPAVQTRACAL